MSTTGGVLMSTTGAVLRAFNDLDIGCEDDRALTGGERCAAPISATERQLQHVVGELPLVLVYDRALVRRPTEVVPHQDYAHWRGTVRTVDGRTRFGAPAVIHGHLPVPRSTVDDGAPSEQVSLSYPRESQRCGLRPDLARQILPRPTVSAV
ncbi:hypothetical protein [Streptomyces sp. NPDC088719]|uniref:hypothetical protein n=1 Tax=Streptomyces sp. NPDC088719 TaxID=3365872 RepID=UPI003806982B